MNKRPKRIYVIDCEPHLGLVEEFLSYAAIDPIYAVNISNTANTILTKRQKALERERAKEISEIE